MIQVNSKCLMSITRQIANACRRQLVFNHVVLYKDQQLHWNTECVRLSYKKLLCHFSCHRRLQRHSDLHHLTNLLITQRFAHLESAHLLSQNRGSLSLLMTSFRGQKSQLGCQRLIADFAPTTCL